VNKGAIIATIAALQGAAGVSLAAAAAHVDANPLLTTASQFLMFHAGAGLAVSALTRGSPLFPRLLTSAAFALQAGVTLFSADLAARVYLGGKLFPFAAPTGGSLTIIAWLALALWGALRIGRADCD
jgi:uncharacterized membrane protein YgdD (TMEM256/DUF423 family)